MDGPIEREGEGEEKPEQKPSCEKTKGPGASAAMLPVGVAVGTALGVALDNLAIGIALGTALGASLMVATSGACASKKKGDSGKKPE